MFGSRKTRTGRLTPTISSLDTVQDSLQLIVTKLLCGHSCLNGKRPSRRTPPLTHRRTLKIYYMTFKVDTYQSYNNLMTTYAHKITINNNHNDNNHT